MKCSNEYKRKCADMYREGRFRKTIGDWFRIEEAAGPEAPRHKRQNKEWTAESPDIEQISRMLHSDFERFPHTDGLIWHHSDNVP